MERKDNAPSPAAEAGALSALQAGLWLAVFAALAVVPDQKILRYKLLAVECGVAALLFSVFASWLSGPRARWSATPLDIPVALYAAGGFVFYLASPEPGVSEPELVRIVFCAATFFAAAQTLPGLKLRPAVLYAWLGGAALCALYALLQLRGGLGALEVPLLERPAATFGNPIFLAAYLGAAAAAAGARALSCRPGMERNAAALLAALLAGATLAARSRAALAGVIGASFLAALLRARGRRRLLTAAGVLAAALAAAYVFKDRQWTHGLIWTDTLSLWLKRPLAGCGLGRFHVEFPAHASEALKSLWPQGRVIVNYAHNEYLQILAETGMLGLGLFAYVIAAGAALLRRRLDASGAEEKFWLAPAAAAAAVLLIGNFFSPDIRFGLSSFLLFFALGAVASEAAVPRALPAFPGRYGAAALACAALAAWGVRAAQPVLAQRRLSREPAFHAPATEQALEAIARLERALAAAPEDADIAENLAFLYAKQSDWSRAVSRFALAAKLDPKRPGPFNNLGNIHYLAGDKQRAIGFWLKSLEADPGQLDAHLNLGKTLYELGRLKEASPHLQKVLEKEPDNEKALILLKKMVE